MAGGDGGRLLPPPAGWGADEDAHERAVAQLLASDSHAPVRATGRGVGADVRVAPADRVIAVSAVDTTRVRGALAALRAWPMPYPVIAVVRERYVLAFWSTSTEDEERELLRAHAALDRRYGPVVMAVAGAEHQPLADAATEATAVLDLVRHRRPAVYRLEDVALEALIHGIRGRTEEVVRQALDAARAHDHSTGTELVTTLRVYLECGASLAETARLLSLHRNTVTYRLERLKALTGRDPSDPRDLFLLYASLLLDR